MPKATCSMPDCSAPTRARGWCKKHYARWRAHGDPTKARPRRAVFEPVSCRVDGCENLTTLRSYDGLCEMHIGRLRRTGSLDARQFCPTKAMTPADVLHLRSEPHGDCVLWTGALTVDFYAVEVRSPLGGKTKAHRASYQLAHGPIPDGLQLDHLCHTRDDKCIDGKACLHRRCINPDHMEVVTWEENLSRRHSRLPSPA